MLFKFSQKNRVIVISGFLLSIISCHSSINSRQVAGKVNDGSKGEVGTTNEINAFKAHFTLSSASSYSYTITSESEIDLEAGGKEVNN